MPIPLITAVFGTTAFILRRLVSRSWIDVRKKQYHEVDGKTIVITGGAGGLGFETAKDLARRNANVIIACRTTAKGVEAATTISNATGNQNVSCVELDLSSLASVRDFISKIQTKYESIDVLICNAGVWVPMEKKLKTKDGYEIHFGVNHLSHLLIAKSLVPQLEKSVDDGRIVFVSSELMKQGTITDLESTIYEGRQIGATQKKSFLPTGYFDTKLMNALTCKYMTTILPPTVSTYAVCPGFCRTSLGRNIVTPLHEKILVAPIMLMIQRTQIQGAQNICFAAMESKDKLVSGGMYRDGELMKDQMDYMEGIGGFSEAKKLWDVSEGLLKEQK